MWHALVWLLTAACAAGWSLMCWALHQLITGPDWQATGDGAWLDWLTQWRIPVWLADWLPLGAIGELQSWLTMLGPWVEAVVTQAPGLLGWLAPLVWVGWGLGLLVLVLLGVVGSVVVAVVRRAVASAHADPGQAPNA